MESNFKIIGTSHVAKESVKEIKNEMDGFDPHIVCIELDESRLAGLINKSSKKIGFSAIFKIGFFGFIFAKIGQYFQKKIGKKLNIIPGNDMLSAFNEAKKANKNIFLVDQDISITLKKLSKSIGIRDIFNMLCDVFKGIFFPKKAMRDNYGLNMGIKDLNKVPSKKIIKKAIGMLKKRYPGMHKALVEDRNHVMSRRIVNIIKKYPESRVLIVVGAGHKEEMDKIINKKLNLIDRL
ncbi:MAG: TraB/GumN family protein [Nanobdellota archaeon]